MRIKEHLTGIPVCRIMQLQENHIPIQIIPETEGKGRKDMKLGFIGLGIMGRPMAKNLLKAGVEVVCADLNKEAVADVVANGGVEASYAEIGEQCEVIITMVPSGPIVQSILLCYSRRVPDLL